MTASVVASMAVRMKSWLAACALLSLLFGSAPAAALSRGALAPEFSLRDAAGRTVSLASLRGRTVYLDFWASWCGPCRHSFPWMGELQQRHGAERLTVLAINVDEDPQAAAAFLREHPALFTVLYDPRGGTATRYDLPGMPASFLIGPDGRVRWAHLGFRPGDGERLEVALRQSLGERPE